MEFDVNPVTAETTGKIENIDKDASGENEDNPDHPASQAISPRDDSAAGDDITPKTSEQIEPVESDSVKPPRGKKSLQRSAERVIAYEKMIALRDKEILALRNNAKLLEEKVALLENSSLKQIDTESIQMREVELEFMHQENDRVRQEATVENERLSTELETLKKEIAASQERMEREQKETEAELAREKDRNNTLSEKLADATLVSERTMLAYGTQENLLKAKQEIIDTLKKESECIAQPSKAVTMSNPVKEVETMTSNTDLTSESADMVPRSKVVELTDHYDAKNKSHE